MRYYEIKLSDIEFENAVNKAFRYAVLSLPYTINRMGLMDINQRILNITKGKLAEEIFRTNYQSVGNLDFKSCSTPFFLPDKRDFIWNNGEWDLKNNFLTLKKPSFQDLNLDELPALVPDRNPHDQWGKRNMLYFDYSQYAGYVFSFMVSSYSLLGPRTPLLTVELNKYHLKFLNELMIEKENTPRYSESWFFEKWLEYSMPWDEPEYQIGFNSPMLVTAYASNDEWPLFNSLAPSLFKNGIIKTRIQNQFCPIGQLPSFHGKIMQVF